MNLAIVDLDGVVADNTERMMRADIAKSLYLSGTDRPDKLQREATDVYWREVFTPELVRLDTLIENVNQDLMDIQYHGYKVVFLTSRPESMRNATVQWLFEHTVYDRDDELVMKSPAFQYTKTTIWKAGVVQTLAMLYDADEVIFVDDQQENIDELVKHGSLDGRLHVWCYKTLAEAKRHAES